MVTRELRRHIDHRLSSSSSVDFNYLEQDSTLFVLNIQSAKQLVKKDIFGLSDPYVRVKFFGNDIQVLSHHSTRTIKRTLQPVWNEKICCMVPGSTVFAVVLDVFDENILTRDDHLGRVVLFYDLSTNSSSAPPPSHVISNPAILTRGETYQGWIDEVSVRLHNISIRSKYSTETRSELTSLIWYTKWSQILKDLQLEYISKQSRSNDSSGLLNLSYCFMKPDLEPAVSLMEECGVNVTQRMVISFPHLDRIRNRETPPTNTQTSPSHESRPSRTNRSSSSSRSIEDPSLAVSLGFELVEQDSSSDEEESLPDGWERRVDSNGRRVFINHSSRSTSLRRPRGRPHPPQQQSTNNTRRTYLPRLNSIEVVDNSSTDESSDDEERQEETSSSPAVIPSAPPPPPLPQHQLTLEPTAPSAPVLEPSLQPITEQQQGSNIASDTRPHPSNAGGATPVVSEATTHSSSERGAVGGATPVVQLTPQQKKLAKLQEGLPQGWTVGLTPEGKTFYINHINKKTVWDRPKKQERKPARDERGSKSQLVTQTEGDLPDGWEARQTADGKIYYVDHHSKKTTWDHPKAKLGPLPKGWEMKVRADGQVFYIDHNTKSTQWEDPRLLAKNKPTHEMKYSRDYKQKYNNFIIKLRPNYEHSYSNKFKVPVKRSNMLEDSYNAIMTLPRDQLSKLKAWIWVEFDGEQGLDYGGLAREWFYLLSHEMFNPYYGLFEYSASDDYTLQINPESGTYNDNHLDYFKFIGRICGMAIYHKNLIDAFFIRPFYKMIVNRTISLKDMESVDIELYNSIKYIMDNDPEPLCLTFAVNKTVFGELLEEELKPGGKDIDVTESNKKEYIDLMIKWRFTRRVEPQMNAFRNGLSDVVPLYLLKVFDERELEYVLGGLSQIDVNDWKKNTELSGYTLTDSVIVWFWKAIENYDDEMRARLLQFVTGTSKVPMNGFAELQGSSGPKKFCIKKYGKPDDLPRAHTCFNRIDLPPYRSYHQLKENLKLAVENTEGFEGVD